ncbi:MAG TPA: class I SAM-dependent methyltransferase, partial [Actinomycetota bacterium]|nr:class I SAM-dependent methyltransferase [Actinomycetota bacterium]
MGTTAQERTDRLNDKIFAAGLGATDLTILYLGEKLGLFRAIAAAGSATPAELAKATGTAGRYCREWLEAAAATEFLEVDDPAAAPDERRFRIPAGGEALLADPADPSFQGYVPMLFTGCIVMLPAIVEAFRTGGGVPWSQYGPDVIDGQEAQNRNLYLSSLATEWLPKIPDVHARLSEPGARVADVACGTGWSSIAIAEAYPGAEVHGFDLDEYSIAKARGYAEERGLAGRVRFEVRDAADPSLSGAFDLVLILEALHDMGDPVAVLRATRSLAGDRGMVVVMDEKTEETFTPNAPDLERLFYGFSLLACLPAALADGPVGTGTVMRP